MDARSGGALAVRETPSGEICIGLDDGQGLTPVIWPAGFTARLDPLELLDANGSVVAREGQYLIVSGGYVPTQPPSLGKTHSFCVQHYEIKEHPEPNDVRPDAL